MIRRNKLRPFLSNVLLLSISLLVALLLSELMVRIFVEPETKRLAVYDDVLGWTGRPNGEEIYIRKKDSIRIKFKYNNLGFRDDDLKQGKGPGKRIMMLGDSFVESLEVSLESVFHKILENDLRSHGTYDEIVAIGSQGYSTAQELLAYRKYRQQVNPDLAILIFYTGNDFEDNLRKQFAFLDENQNLRFPESTNSPLRITYLKLKRSLYENSYLVFFLKNLITSKFGVKIAADGKQVVDSGNEYSLNITKALILQMKREVENDDIPFGLVILPSKKHLSDLEKVNFVATLCEREGIPFISFHDKLESSDYFDFDVHLNKTGHEKVAVALSSFIREHF